MRFEPLDMFKIVPITVSWFAGVGLLEVLHPLGYTNTQYYIYGIAGATIGGLYSIAYLGGLAKGGNKSGLKKMAMVMALAFIVDAPIVRDKVIDVTINQKYTELKKEYLTIPKTENLNTLKQELAKTQNSINLEKLRLEELNRNSREKINIASKEEYLKNYKIYGWWRKKAELTGCNISVGLTDNQLERIRRIKCISNSLYKSIKSDKLNRLEIEIKSIKSKISIIKNKNSQTIEREKYLKKQIIEAEMQTLPMFAFYIIMFFVGWGFEVFLPHLKYWRDWQNHDAHKKGKTVSHYQKIKQEESNKRLMEHTDKFLSDVLLTQKDALNWIQKVLGNNVKMNAKINTFFAIILALKNDEEKLVISTIQNYSWFRNPDTGKKYNTQNHTVKIVNLFEKNGITKNNMPIHCMEDILKKVKNL